jgi:hypothetical protein
MRRAMTPTETGLRFTDAEFRFGLPKHPTSFYFIIHSLTINTCRAQAQKKHNTQLLIEFHFSSLPLVLNAFDGLAAHGYRIFSVEPNYYADARKYLEYAFIKVCEPGKGNVPKTSWYPRPCESEQY